MRPSFSVVPLRSRPLGLILPTSWPIDRDEQEVPTIAVHSNSNIVAGELGSLFVNVFNTSNQQPAT